jgi:serine/threonine protein kinase
MIGRVIEGFEVVEKLGEGGMGIVYRAVDTTLGRVVALKALHSELTKDPQLTERFLSEARTQAQLNHPNLATLYRLFQHENNYFMVMEFVEGETISQKIRNEGPIPQERALGLFKQALAGLAHAHHAGIIHRDIKPSNLMVNRDHLVKVMDFGIAKVLGGRGLTATGVRLGTLYYMAPEQIRNQPLDIRTDIYALGITFYEMLTARVPFDSNSDYDLMQQHIQQAPPPPRTFFPYLNAALEAAILQALEKDPGRRFQTVEAFSNALDESIKAGLIAPYQTPARPAPPPYYGAPAAGPTAVRPGSTPLPASAPTIVTPVPPRYTPPPASAPTMVTPVPPRPTPPPAASPTIMTPIPPARTPTPAPTAVPYSSSRMTPPRTPTPYPATPVPPQGFPEPAKKPLSGPVLWVVLGIVLLAILGVSLVIRQVRKARALINASSNQAQTQPTQPVPSAPAPTPNPQPAVTQALPPSTSSEGAQPSVPPPAESKEKKSPKDARKTTAGMAKDGSRGAPAATIDAATQALVQQQIEAERQRLAKQTSQEQQKTAATPLPTGAPTNPSPAVEKTFRWRVEHSHGSFGSSQKCVGTLVASQSRVSFFPESGPHSFDVPSSQVKEVRKNSGLFSGQSFHIKLANGENYNFTRIGTDNKALPSNEIVTQMQALLAPPAK